MQWFDLIKEGEGQGGDQDQEERRWNKRTQQMLHGLQVRNLHYLRIIRELVKDKQQLIWS